MEKVVHDSRLGKEIRDRNEFRGIRGRMGKSEDFSPFLGDVHGGPRSRQYFSSTPLFATRAMQIFVKTREYPPAS